MNIACLRCSHGLVPAPCTVRRGNPSDQSSSRCAPHTVRAFVNIESMITTQGVGNFPAGRGMREHTGMQHTGSVGNPIGARTRSLLFGDVAAPPPSRPRCQHTYHAIVHCVRCKGEAQSRGNPAVSAITAIFHPTRPHSVLILPHVSARAAKIL